MHLLDSAEPEIRSAQQIKCYARLYLSKKCFNMLRKEVPSLSLHNVGLFVLVAKRLLELVES